MTDRNEIYLKDYKEPAFKIQSVDLTFERDEASTIVTKKMHFMNQK